MKVLFAHDGPMLTNYSRTSFFGVHYTDEIIRRYSHFGNSVTFLMRSQVINDANGVEYTPIREPGFSLIEVPNFKSLRTKYMQKEAKIVIRDAVEKNDIIIVRLPSAIGMMAKKAADNLGKPVLVEVVACVYDALWNYDWRGKLLAHYKMYQYQKEIRSAKHVIYVTQKFLQDRYPTNGISIGCSDVVIKEHDNSVLDERLTKIKNISSKIVLGTIAAIDVPYKGQADVIKAIYRLKQKGYSNYVYNIVGQGNPKKLVRLVEKLELGDQIRILGSIPNKQIFDFIDSLDLYLQPSKQEGLPRSVVEAMSRGCPVVATNIAGHPELIDHEALYHAGKINEIVEILKNVKQLPLSRWAIMNYEKSKHYSSDNLNNKRITFYDKFISYARNVY